MEHLSKNIERLFPMRIGFNFINVEEVKKHIVEIVSVGVSRIKVVFVVFRLKLVYERFRSQK